MAKPSFLGSTWSGIKGAFKGALAGTLIGAAIGAAGGAVVGALFPITVVTASAGTLVLGAAALATAGAWMGGALLGGIGAAAGTVTGVVQKREASQVSAEDMAKVANVSFAQGLAVGHQTQLEQQQDGPGWRERVERQRAAAAAQSQQIH